MYLANHYVRINGKVYTRGERIPDGLPESKIRWLLRAGAVKEAVSAQEAAVLMEAAVDAGAGDPEAGRIFAALAGESADTDTEEAAGAEYAEKEETADYDAETPEIDVMAGIVQADEEEEKRPARKSPARKERRKAK